MQSRRVAVVAFAGVSVIAGCGSQKLSEVDLASRVKPTVVELSGKLGDGSVGGSGVVIDAANGYVLTNAHVISGLSALTAKVGDNVATTGPARVVAQAPCDDIAIVQLVNRPAGLKAIEVGSSATVKSGEQVTAFGYPASFENPDQQTVVLTSGPVSSPQVAAEPDASLPKYPSTIQHQAPINPGNSGGPLVNGFGQLIGLNTLTNTQQGGQAIQGQYYAIAIDHIKPLLATLEAGKNVSYAGWDLTPIADVSLRDVFANDPAFNTANDGHDITPAAAKFGSEIQRAISQDTAQQGLYVNFTDTGSPAKKAKVFGGDMITSIEDTPVKTVSDVCAIIASHGPGSRISIRGRYLDSATNVDTVDDPWKVQMTLK